VLPQGLEDRETGVIIGRHTSYLLVLESPHQFRVQDHVPIIAWKLDRKALSGGFRHQGLGPLGAAFMTLPVALLQNLPSRISSISIQNRTAAIRSDLSREAATYT